MRKTLTIAAVAASLLLPAATAQADGVRATSCINSWRSMTCVTNWRKWYPEPPKPPTEQEIAESRERDRKWQARCQPIIQQDGFGVARYTYAAPGCEFGRVQ